MQWGLLLDYSGSEVFALGDRSRWFRGSCSGERDSPSVSGDEQDSRGKIVFCAWSTLHRDKASSFLTTFTLQTGKNELICYPTLPQGVIC